MYSTAQCLQVKDLPPSCGTKWMFHNLCYPHAVQSSCLWAVHQTDAQTQDGQHTVCCGVCQEHIGGPGATSKQHLAVSALHACTESVHCMQEALNRGLLPDDNTLMQLSQEKDSIVHGRSLDSMRWPDLELRAVLIRKTSQ